MTEARPIARILEMKTTKKGSHLLRKGRYSQAGGIYFITTSTFQRYPLFRTFTYACVMSRQLHAIESLNCCKCLCWVVMPDHIHLLVQLTEGSLNQLVQQLKSRSAVMINRQFGTNGTIWSKGFYDHALRRHESIQSISDYIIHNPVRAGLVAHPSKYPFWNSAWI
jgi:REP element-mobilizing transposase RayT